MKKLLTLTCLVGGLAGALASTAVRAEQPEEGSLNQEARQQAMMFGKQLMQTVQKGMKAGGPTEAIHLCNVEAPEIATAHSQGDWAVGRTSLKIRNPDNAPDSWELATLKDFDQRLAAGETPATLEASIVENGEYRYMKAIPTGALCLNCHGSALAEPVQTRLSKLYPHDKAVGYQAGQLRGAFTLRKTLAE
ncbi:DUF3365 domain-containing protein [Oceanobacter sp. 5_MG-2023]|uniref:Tll0287-like domain-containing protein n=1 Tax=Oceanobacter sp. 5_MG-2023 TaxID=3062645 RepID=UPI0026E1DDBE|nr:DUF3365 domain-containing protein [Oceanobacter sp. 5_MG-2023]MDO6681917.1 DUF3365 domain-containing protein [Oceanobacter sp. 5_MG-2023]